MVGQTLSHYKVTEKLGEGGMGVVYLAEDTRLGREVALKFLPREATAREEDRQRFEQEARAAARLNHPNICTLYHFDEHEGRPFLVMEYVEGKTLRDLMSEGPLPVEEAVDYARQIAGALSEAHEAGIIHRDIKPSNVMVDEKGQVKVMDFGIAKLKGGERITETGDTLGTVAYMAPEQIQGKDVDRRADLFSLGVVLYEMLTGRHPFPGEYRQAIAYQIIHEEAEPPSTYREELPAKVDEVVLRCLEKAPTGRYSSAEELLSDLREATEKEAVASASGAGGSASDAESLLSGQGWLKKRPVAGIGAIGALAVVALLMGWWFLSGSASEEAGEAIPGENGAETTRHSIAVLPFQVSGSGAEEWEDGMVTMLSLNLDGTAGLRAITDRTVFATLREQGFSEEGLGTQDALEVARAVGARYAVVGTAVQIGEDLRFGADVHETLSGERLGHVEVRGAPERVTALADELTRQVLGVLLERSEERVPSVDLESLTTESLPALKAFLRGERHLRAGDNDAAIERYEEAVEADSSFALPYARIGFIGLWRHAWEGEAMRRAYELSDQLPERDRRLVRALYLGRIEHRTLEAAERLRQLTEDYPDDPLIWHTLGEFIFHARIPGGEPEVEEAHRRAIDLDPGHTSYYNHYVEPAFYVHRDSALVAERISAMPEGQWKRVFENGLELVFGTPEEQQRALDRLDTLTIPEPWLAYAPLGNPKDLDLSDRVLRRLLSRKDLSDDPYALRFVLNDFHRGQVEQALTDLERLDIGPGVTAAFLSPSMSLGVPIPEAALRRYLEPENLPADPSLRHLKSSGLYLIEQERDEDLKALIDRIRRAAERSESEGPSTHEVEAIVQELRGYRAFRAGHLEEAQALLSRSNESWREGAIWRGDLYRELGELERAEGWYLVGWRHPVAQERLGQLYEETGRPEEAAEAYERFIEAWAEADPALQERVEAARERLESLTEEGALPAPQEQ